MTDRELIEKLDVLRPASDDLERLADGAVRQLVERDATARALYERLQNWDTKLAAAVRDVEAPPEFEKRLLDELNHRQPQLMPAGRLPGEESAASEPNRRWRRWAVSAAVLATAAAVFVMAFGPWTASPDLRVGDELLAEAILFYRNEAGQATQPFKVLADHPLSLEIKSGWQPEWRKVSGFLGYSGVAYEFRGPGLNRATLYVIAAEIPNAAISPRKDVLSSGHWASVWKEGHLVYVLVVRGGSNVQRPEQSYLKPLRQLG